MKKLFIFIFAVVLFSQLALAVHDGHIKLLAVNTDGVNESGSVADLFLEISPGTGRVFIDTYPLTKLDTQFSTRFAKSVACDYLDADCSKYDFFYTITSRSSIVGGPSAGTAITLLTIATLIDLDIGNDFAITGTINSGGLVGPVGGIKPKVEAAKNAGLKKVIIPKLSIGNTTETQEFLDNLTGINVVKVSSVDGILFHLTGKNRFVDENLEISPEFKETMKDISKFLCDATIQILRNDTNTSQENEALKLYQRSLNAAKAKTYYSAASFCFGANVRFRQIDLQNKSNEELLVVYQNIKSDIESLEINVEKEEINTIADLQTYMIVKERLIDAYEYVRYVEDLNNLSYMELAYSIERYNSAVIWSRFFGSGDKEYVINNDSLRQTCISKISEIESFLQYIAIYINTPLKNTEKNIERAKRDLLRDDFELCIFKASKAKAEAGLVLEAFSISIDNIDELIEEKSKLAKNNIIRAQLKGVFPILGYSYYEYANSLKEFDTSSSLLYLGYSIEVSNLGAYFEEKNGLSFDIDYFVLSIFLIGLFLGVVFGFSMKKK